MVRGYIAHHRICCTHFRWWWWWWWDNADVDGWCCWWSQSASLERRGQKVFLPRCIVLSLCLQLFSADYSYSFFYHSSIRAIHSFIHLPSVCLAFFHRFYFLLLFPFLCFQQPAAAISIICSFNCPFALLLSLSLTCCLFSHFHSFPHSQLPALALMENGQFEFLSLTLSITLHFGTRLWALVVVVVLFIASLCEPLSFFPSLVPLSFFPSLPSSPFFVCKLPR